MSHSLGCSSKAGLCVSTRSGVLAHQAHTPQSLVHGHRLCAVNRSRDRRCPSRIIGSDWLCVWMPLQRVIRHEQRCRFSGSSDRNSAVPLQRVTGARLWSTSPHLCGARTGISDATSAGHRIRSTMPLQRVTGSFSSSLSIPASIERWTACREMLRTGCPAWSFNRQTHSSK